MDHTPESAPIPLPSGPPVSDEAHFASLLRQTFAEQASGVALPPDALPRLNARLDAASAPKRWFVPLRVAGAVACALVLLALVTPVGRLAAAGVQNAAEAIVTTVKQIASGDNGTPPLRGTQPAPNATDTSASRTVPTNGAGSPAIGGTANPSSVTRLGTPAGTASQVIPVSPTPRATDQAATARAAGTAIMTPTATASSAVSTILPTAAPAATTTSTIAVNGTAISVTTTASPDPKSPTPTASPVETVSPP